MENSIQKWTIIILGASGDLSRKKLLPALYYLLKHNNNLECIFIGSAKDTLVIQELLREAKSHVKGNREDIWQYLEHHSFYYTMDFESAQDYKHLAYAINTHEKEYNLPGNRLVYLATPAHFYCTITQNLVSAGIVNNQENLQNNIHRIVYEKPFGWDLQSARQINTCIKKLLAHEQIYRVDHYLTKALVSSIALIRFSNIVFEALWNCEFIDHVQIIFSERETVQDRGEFYDAYGALKDVVQNHMFQLLSLIAMESPATLNAHDISKEKARILKHTRIIDGLLGQYSGYTQEPGVEQKSMTETYAVLKCYVDTPTWTNVPFYLKTGKALADKSTEIHIVFKKMSKQRFMLPGYYDPNILTIRISPNSGFALKLNVQKAASHTIVPLSMDFCYHCYFGQSLPRSYEILLKEVLEGNQSISVSSQEIEYSWKLLEDVQKLQLPLYCYEQGTSGPSQAQAFAECNNFTWRL